LLNVPGTPFSAVTDSTGSFVIEDIPPGTYTLEFEDPGLRYRAELMPPSFRLDSTQTPVAVGLASRQTLLRALCPADPALSAGSRRTRLPPHELGVLQLTLTNPDGTAGVSPRDQIEIIFELPWREAIRGKYRGNGDGVVERLRAPDRRAPRRVRPARELGHPFPDRLHPAGRFSAGGRGAPVMCRRLAAPTALAYFSAAATARRPTGRECATGCNTWR